MAHQLTQFDLSVLCEQDILTLDVSVDDFMGVEVCQTLRYDRHRQVRSSAVQSYCLLQSPSSRQSG